MAFSEDPFQADKSNAEDLWVIFWKSVPMKPRVSIRSSQPSSLMKREFISSPKVVVSNEPFVPLEEIVDSFQGARSKRAKDGMTIDIRILGN